MRFEIFLVSASIILMLVAVLFDVNYINYEKPIPYSQWQRINFYDFKALKKPKMMIDGEAKFAFIKTNREIEYLNNGDVEITTYFHPSRSYVFEQEIRNPDLLTHELYHFHIAEFFSRLLRKEIFLKSENITKGMINELNRNYYNLEDLMQNEYDQNTYHSYILQQQKNWEARVDSLLLSLQEFSSPVVHLSNKK
jgi:hypothetical protein